MQSILSGSESGSLKSGILSALSRRLPGIGGRSPRSSYGGSAWSSARLSVRRFLFAALVSIVALPFGVATSSVAFAQSGTKLVTDSLVKDLDCGKLTIQNVLRFAKKDQAFSATHHLPIRNWNSQLLGQCWSLASAQRRFFYLTRTQSAGVKVSKAAVHQALDLVRGAQAPKCEKQAGPDEFATQSCSEEKLKLRVLPISEASIGVSQLLATAIKGVTSPVPRSFQSEIEIQQQKKFYDLSNIGLLTGAVAQSAGQNQITMNQLVASLEMGRLPLIVIRGSIGAQHVVLVKSFLKKSDKSVLFRVYDSNVPSQDNALTYENGVFNGQYIVGLFDPANAHRPAGVFIRDEAEMDEIQSALYSHYRQICSRK